MKKSYKVGGQKVSLTVSEQFVAVRFTEPAPYSARATAAARPEIGGFDKRYEIPREKFTVLEVARTPQPSDTRLEGAMRGLQSDKSVDRVSPVFVIGRAHATATDRLMVGFSTSTGAKKKLKEHGCDIVEQRGDEFVVRLDPSVDPFEVVEQLDALSEVEYAEPDFVSFGVHTERRDPDPSPADPLAPDQYAIEITKAKQAWAIQKGDASIRIAILDEGVDTVHEDLSEAVVGQYDGVDGDTYQEPKAWDAHGTACAGLAAATHDNDTGIKGIGGGCSLLAVRIAYSPYKNANWVTTNSWIRRAIDWAWGEGADVLSNSWGGGAPSSAITNAFERARTQGRNGKGCVLVVAAGNADELHDYPGNLDDVLTVSASNEYDEPKTPSSQDGEYWWGSNYGPKIDVAAPGVHNYTSDNTGTDGYNDEPAPAGNYVPDFNGTSSSTPIVAGAVGLVLSANPELNEAEVREIIRSTADKVGPLPYVDGRNDRMGHGRINALAAVQAAKGVDDTVLPTGKHTPVSNQDSDSESEVYVRATHPGTQGSAKTTKAKTSGDIEEVADSGPSSRSNAKEMKAPDTEGLRNIAEASYGPPPPEPETVHGPDDRVRIHGTQQHPWRMTASLRITARDGSMWIGTGWFIGPRTLVTAGHVVYIKGSPIAERNGWVRRIEVMPGRNGNDLPFGLVVSEEFHSVVGWTEDGDHEYDYGAITIHSDLGEEVGTFGFGVLDKNDILGSTANIAGYPGDQPSGTLWYDYEKIAAVTARKVYYDIDTAGGQSGAAVYRIDPNGRTAFAIHAYGGASFNSATRITTPVFQNLTNWLDE